MQNHNFISVPLDLNDVKCKVVFGLTKRQLICFGIAVAIGLPIFFILKAVSSNLYLASTVMCLVMSPAVLCGLFCKNGLYLDDYAKLAIQFYRKPKIRVYQSENIFAMIGRNYEYIKLKKKLR